MSDTMSDTERNTVTGAVPASPAPADVPTDAPNDQVLRTRGRQIGYAAVVVALLAVAGWRGYVWWHLDQQQSDRASAISVASAEVTGLISINASTSQADIDALLGRATSDFKSQLGQQSQRLRAALSANKVAASGSVVSAGIASYGGDGASVIVAAAGTVKNRSTAQAQPRNYRVQVSLQRIGGTWLVSGLELVS